MSNQLYGVFFFLFFFKWYEEHGPNKKNFTMYNKCTTNMLYVKCKEERKIYDENNNVISNLLETDPADISASSNSFHYQDNPYKISITILYKSTHEK